MKRIIFSLFILGATISASAEEGYLDRSKWKWFSSSICEPYTDTDIRGLEGLYDGDPTTCWHSNYRAAAGTAERSNPHWIMIDRGTDTSEITAISYLPRQNSVNQACTSYYIYLADRDLGSCPATSAADILSAMGTPDVSGIWEASLEEKTAKLEKPCSARYILFVNVTSVNSSSAACAEFNLIGPNGSGGGTPATDAYNAVRILPADGSAPHQIAIQGDALTFTMQNGYIRMANSDIIVEYLPEEISAFKFIHYDFPADKSYIGDRDDVRSEISEPRVATLGIERRGNELLLSGADGIAELYDLKGHIVARGQAAISVGGLQKGVYILKANNITLKITL